MPRRAARGVVPPVLVRLSARAGGASHYAEKVPAWLPSWVRPLLPCATVHLCATRATCSCRPSRFCATRASRAASARRHHVRPRHARNLAHALLLYTRTNGPTAPRRRDARPLRGLRRRPHRRRRSIESADGLEFPADGGDEYLGRHRTSADPVASVGRWRREGLPRGVREMLETHLGELLTDHRYDPATMPPAPQFVPSPQFELPEQPFRRRA